VAKEVFPLQSPRENRPRRRGKTSYRNVFLVTCVSVGRQNYATTPIPTVLPLLHWSIWKVLHLYHLDTDSSLISTLFPMSGRIVLKNCRLLQKTFRPGVTSGFSRACMCEPPPTWTSRKEDSYACRFCFGKSASEMEQVRHPPMLEGCSWPFFRMQRRSDCSLLGKPPSIQLLLLRIHWLS